jgi:hypothetical protein
MKIRRIDAWGNVVEVESPVGDSTTDDTAAVAHASGTGVVGAIGAAITDPLEMPSRTMRAESPPARDRLTTLLANLTAVHVTLARWFRRRVLLMPDIDYRTVEANQRTIANRFITISEKLSEVRVRLAHHEREIPLLGQSRRQFDAQEKVNQRRVEAAMADVKAEVERRQAPKGPA